MFTYYLEFKSPPLIASHPQLRLELFSYSFTNPNPTAMLGEGAGQGLLKLTELNCLRAGAGDAASAALYVANANGTAYDEVILTGFDTEASDKKPFTRITMKLVHVASFQSGQVTHGKLAEHFSVTFADLNIEYLGKKK
jgi:hypothetical protein